MIPVGRVRLALWAALLAACVAVIARTQISTDMSAFLPRSPSPAQQVLVDQVREGVVSRLILLGLEGAPPAALAKLSRELARRLRGVDAFASVSNGDDSALAAERDFLWRNRFVLSPSVAPARFTSAGLHDALQRDVELLSSGLAVLVKQTLASDPTGEMLTVIDEFLGEHGPHKADGVWFSPDETRALVVVQTRAGGLDTDAQQQALRAIDDAFRAARQVVPEAAAAHLLETGPGVFAVHTRATMEEDVSRFSTLATVLIAGLLLFAYRSLREMIELPIVKKHLGPLLERHRRSIEVLRERIDARDGVIYFDVSDLDLEGYNKFIPYYLNPGALYSVGLSASPTRAKVSVGTSPWKDIPPNVNLASLCEKYGGGGHARVAAISFGPGDLVRARQVAKEIAATLRG